jgi:hypothetical protein
MSLHVGSLVTSSRQSYMFGDPRRGRVGLIVDGAAPALDDADFRSDVPRRRWTVLWSDGSCYVAYGYSLRTVEQEV